MKEVINRKFCVAPMMGYTTPYARNLYRILSKKAFLFTEMIATKTLIHARNNSSTLANKNQNPIALQVGGSEYQDLNLCSKLAYELNYDDCVFYYIFLIKILILNINIKIIYCRTLLLNYSFFYEFIYSI